VAVHTVGAAAGAKGVRLCDPATARTGTYLHPGTRGACFGTTPDMRGRGLGSSAIHLSVTQMG